MTTPFSIRPYQISDAQAINDRFNEVFGCRRTLDEWHWKFQPEKEGCRIMLAVDATDAIVAQFAAVVSTLQVDGRRHLVGQVLDVFSRRDADVVTQRVYLQTARQFFRTYGTPDDLALVYGFPGDRALRLGRRQLNYADPLPVPVWRRTTRLRLSWQPQIRVESHCTPEALDELWSRVVSRYPVCVPRDGAWLQHRCLDHPTRPYQVLTAWRRQTLLAVAVVAITRAVGRWIDLIWDGHSRDALRALDRAVARHARASGATRLELWLSGDSAASDVLEAAGWAPGRHDQGLGLSAVSFDPALDPHDVLRRFYLTMADSDLV